MTAPVEVELPVSVRVGDGELLELGTVVAESAAGAQRGVPRLLRAIADEMEAVTGADDGGAAGPAEAPPRNGSPD